MNLKNKYRLVSGLLLLSSIASFTLMSISSAYSSFVFALLALVCLAALIFLYDGEKAKSARFIAVAVLTGMLVALLMYVVLPK